MKHKLEFDGAKVRDNIIYGFFINPGLILLLIVTEIWFLLWHGNLSIGSFLGSTVIALAFFAFWMGTSTFYVKTLFKKEDSSLILWQRYGLKLFLGSIFIILLISFLYFSG